MSIGWSWRSEQIAAQMRVRNAPQPRRKCISCGHKALIRSQYCRPCSRLSDRLRIGKAKRPITLTPDQALYMQMQHIERDLFGPPGNIRISAQFLESYAIG